MFLKKQNLNLKNILMARKLTLTEIEGMSPAGIKGLEGTIIVSSKYVLALFTAKLRKHNINYKVNYVTPSVEIVK